MNSGRAVFIYGPAGTGKTYVTHRLARLFRDVVLIPHAIAVDETIVQVFDPLLHKAVRVGDRQNIMLQHGHDARYVACERPVIVTGGELTIDMLDVRYDASTRQYEAPLQLKANNGMFVIDDLGRQRVAPDALLNRWIVPMNEHRDYHSLGSGRHFVAPFDVVLVFSSNMHPLELTDEAFLRRIGHKIYCGYVSREGYEQIWESVCDERDVAFDPEIVRFVIEELHARSDVPLLPCHPQRPDRHRARQGGVPRQPERADARVADLGVGYVFRFDASRRSATDALGTRSRQWLTSRAVTMITLSLAMGVAAAWMANNWVRALRRDERSADGDRRRRRDRRPIRHEGRRAAFEGSRTCPPSSSPRARSRRSRRSWTASPCSRSSPARS